MKKIEIIIIMIMSIAIIFALTGCGSSDSSDGDQAQGTVAEEGFEFVAETVDLDGNTVNTADLFAQNKITMVNIWATCCGPCINEMPELEKIHQEYAEEGAGVIGLVLDVPAGNDQLLQDALDILDETGVTYTNIRAWNGLGETLQVNAVPTTYFVDSEGKIMGDPIVGADIEQYRRTFKNYLSLADVRTAGCPSVKCSIQTHLKLIKEGKQ